MPSLVHASPRLTGSPGVALLSHSVAEQVNGLYSVSCEFVCRASNSVAVDNLFYPDAEPPIYPASINRQYLLAGRLFMSSREVKTENGLCYISASYASGITRGGSFGYVTTERESPLTKTYVIAVNNDGSTIAFTSFSYLPIVITHEYVQVGSEKSSFFEAPLPEQLYVLLSYTGAGVGVNPKLWAIRSLNPRAREDDTQRTSVTPSVIVKQTRYYIEEDTSV